jgi:hypothetical protein
MYVILHVFLALRYIFRGPNYLGNSNAQNRAKIRIVFNLTNLIIGEFIISRKVTQKPI